MSNTDDQNRCTCDGQQEFREDIKRFADTYLYEGLNRAGAANEDANIAMFALMECMWQLVVHNTDSNEKAMETFQSMIDSFMSDWRAASEERTVQ